MKLSDQEFDKGWCDLYLDTYRGIDNLLAELKLNYKIVAFTNTNIIHPMKSMSILLSTFFFLLSCTNQKIANDITIQGQVENIPNGKIYLTEAHNWQVPLDSTTSINGHFVFKIRTDSSFVPYMASISYPDSASPTKISLLAFSNDFVLPPDTTKFYNYYYSAFYLEKGLTIINNQERFKQKFRGGIPVTIKTGKETEIMYRNQFTDFGWLSNIDSLKRLQRITSFKNEIRKHPFSYFLLQNIYKAKEQYSEKEMTEILSIFNADVQKSTLGDRIKTYLINRPDPNAPYPNLSLVNSINQRSNIIDPTAKLNMLVFWASWCGPCRKEIPILKEIHNDYKGKGLNVVSISIDEDKVSWEKALRQEKMIWSQYLVDKEKIDLVKQQFNFSAIPLVVFTDKAGKEIKKFTGYDKEQKTNYEAVINKVIKSQ
ncbi:MAG: TlpA disulfide reductase family protein [Chitinophagaceae bacterium]